MKPVRSEVRNDRLAEALAEGDHFVEDFGIGGDGANHFDQLHHWHGIEEVHADKTVGALGEGGHFG